MNYAGPITIGVILIALADWFTTGKRRFKVPTGTIVILDEELEMDKKADKKRKSSE
jgi:hypothetical protein